jgi:hypothetical protein
MAMFVLIALLVASRSPEPEVLSVRRLEVVDPQGEVVGGFGIAALRPAQPASSEGDRLSWVLQDPATKTRAWASVDPHGAAMLHLDSDKVSAGLWGMSNGAGAAVESTQRGALLVAQDPESSLWFQIADGWEPEAVLALTHISGTTRIQGWDETSGPTFDFR